MSEAEEREKAERVERAKVKLLDMMLAAEELPEGMYAEILALKAYKTLDITLTKLLESAVVGTGPDEKTELKLQIAEYFGMVETGVKQFIKTANIEIYEGE